MAYLDIDNLYKEQSILMMKECYAMEKIHGTSAHITYKDGRIGFFAGGGNYENFVKLFDEEVLKSKFGEMGLGEKSICVYGESYGGKMQGMSATYGKEAKFVAFEVKIGDTWLNVPKAEAIVKELGLEFVSYVKIRATIEEIDVARGADSVQAVRNGMGESTDKFGFCPPKMEGIVLRPLEEVILNNGSRVIAKHKRDDFRETKTPRKVVDSAQIKILEEAKAIADEWVTHERLNHVLTSGKVIARIENTGEVIRLMVDDVLREGAGEIVDSPEARKQISRATALMFKQNLQKSLTGGKG